MKLRNTIAMISFLIAAVSCSMEDSVLNEMTINEPANETQKEVCFNLSFGSIATRANSSELDKDTKDGELDHISVVIVNSVTDKVVTAKDNIEVSSIAGKYTSNANFFVKEGTYKIHVIGFATTSSTTSFMGYTTGAALEAAVLGEDALKNLVTYDMVTKTLTYDPQNTLQTVSVNLKHQTAQVKLSKVELNGFSESSLATTVKLTNVALVNRVENQTLKTNFSPVIDYLGSASKAFDNALTETGLDLADFTTFTTFPNPNPSEDVAAIAMKLTFLVGEGANAKEQTRTYVINRPTANAEEPATDAPYTDFTNNSGHEYVVAGNIYELYVGVTLDGDQVKCAVRCVVQDWAYNEYQIDLEDITTK